MTNQNAFIGMDVERLFKNSIGKNKKALRALIDRFEIEGEFAKAFSTGTDAGKSDVIIRFTDGKSLSANIKAYKTGFNQLTRTTIASFCREFDIDNLRQIFEDGAVRVATRTGQFILSSDAETVVDTITPIARKIVEFSLARDEKPELLVLYNRGANQMNLFDLADTLNSLDYSVSLSGRGIIRIGKYVTIQRKGGNGVHSLHIPKSSLAHPGNNLQVKMKVATFALEVQPIVVFEP